MINNIEVALIGDFCSRYFNSSISVDDQIMSFDKPSIISVSVLSNELLKLPLIQPEIPKVYVLYTGFVKSIDSLYANKLVRIPEGNISSVYRDLVLCSSELQKSGFKSEIIEPDNRVIKDVVLELIQRNKTCYVVIMSKQDDTRTHFYLNQHHETINLVLSGLFQKSCVTVAPLK